MKEENDAEEGEGKELRALKRRKMQKALTSMDIMSSIETQGMELP